MNEFKKYLNLYKIIFFFKKILMKWEKEILIMIKYYNMLQDMFFFKNYLKKFKIILMR